MSILILSESHNAKVKAFLDSHADSTWSNGLVVDTHANYDAVIVVNSHTAESVRAMRVAMALRCNQPDLPLFVITSVETSADELGDLLAGISMPTIDGEQQVSLDQFDSALGGSRERANEEQGSKNADAEKKISILALKNQTAFIYGN